ncbi:MAG: pyridoxamine 5'-phosphate oxidase [Verrucomicrobiales bacterium]|nr:pyridoxamine 5'-phosphate oxidase [Verrucomicrobiales bacterium]|tara:strand:- start:325 stop:954 length:630 start_codon:yes stop_codon:yes gene_type:complete
MPYEFRDVIASELQMREVMGEPSQLVVDKAVDHLDQHSRAFIKKCPFVVIATTDGNTRIDASPKGDAPGFVQILDERTLVIPDRPGNRRADTFRNVLRHPWLGLIFLVPGMRETLRVNGKAVVTRDQDLRAKLAVNGKTPDLLLGVEIKEVLFHCGKCMIRSGLWTPEKWESCEGLPSLAESLAAVSDAAGDVDELQEAIERAYREKLY